MQMGHHFGISGMVRVSLGAWNGVKELRQQTSVEIPLTPIFSY